VRRRKEPSVSIAYVWPVRYLGFFIFNQEVYAETKERADVMNERFSSVLRLVTLLVRLASGHAVDGALRREVEDVPEERLREGEHQNGSARAGDVGQATMLHAVIEEQRVACGVWGR